MIAEKARTKSLFCVEAWKETRKWDVERTWVWAEDIDDALEAVEYNIKAHEVREEDAYTDGTNYEVYKYATNEVPAGISPYDIDEIKKEQNFE